MYSKRKSKLNRYDLTKEYGIGYTSKDEPFYFDLEDYDKIKDYTWGFEKGGVYSRTNGRKIRMHRLIMKCPKGMVVDHINHNTKDNRKSNLRICTRAENNHNRSSRKQKCCGICYIKKSEKWMARLGRKFLGYFKTEEEAIEARKQAEFEMFGEYSYLYSKEKGESINESFGFDNP